MADHLVTGGAGFIGAALAHRLVAEGHSVTVLDRFSRGKQHRVPDGAHIHQADIRSWGEVWRAVQVADVVWHLAYVQGTQTFYAAPKDVIDVALQGIVNVLRACELHKEPPEFFLVSSSEVYQNPPAPEPMAVTQEMLNLRGPARETTVHDWAKRLRQGMFPTDETVPLSVPDVTNPRYSYGGGKIASEIATLAYADLLKRAVIVRPHNVYGPDMGWDHVIPEFAVRMMELQDATHNLSALKVPQDGPLPFRIQGSGQETRSFCYIDDCIDGLMVLYEKGEHRNVYHLGNPSQERTIADVAFAVADWFDDEIELVPGKLPEGSPTRRLPDISKMQALGFEPRVSLEEGLIPTLTWYQYEVRNAKWKRVEERVRKAA